MRRRHVLATATGVAVAWPACTSWGQPSKPVGDNTRTESFVEGVDYDRIKLPQPPGVAGKIEVIEFFSYACPHCKDFEPALEAWAAHAPRDVALRRIPVRILFNADNFMRTYYALEQMGLVNKMQSVIFDAVHVQRLRLDKPEDIAALVAKNGGDGPRFLGAFKSFSVAALVSRGQSIAEDYGIGGVPTLAIAGRWTTSPAMTKSEARSLAVADALIDRARRGLR